MDSIDAVNPFQGKKRSQIKNPKPIDTGYTSDILRQLAEYGIPPSGSVQSDLQAIEMAKMKKSKVKNNFVPYNTNLLPESVKQNFLRKNNFI